MKSCCLLKGVVVVVLFCVQEKVFTQGSALPATPAKQLIAQVSDSLQPQAAFNLLSFTGTNSSGQNTLNWKTDIRSQFTGFTLERGTDESTFSSLDEVSVSSSSKTNSYTYVDGKPVTGRNFYRLKMTDSSGKSTYSTVISVTHIPANNLQVHYEAASGTIALAGMEAGLAYQLKLYSSGGQMMLQKAVTTAVPSISISQLPHGLYVVYATDGTAAPVSQKIIW